MSEENVIEIYWDGTNLYMYIPASAQTFKLEATEELGELPEEAKYCTTINLSEVEER